MAAFFAISLRFFENNFLALAGPPFRKPFLPIMERYSEIAACVEHLGTVLVLLINIKLLETIFLVFLFSDA